MKPLDEINAALRQRELAIKNDKNSVRSLKENKDFAQIISSAWDDIQNAEKNYMKDGSRGPIIAITTDDPTPFDAPSDWLPTQSTTSIENIYYTSLENTKKNFKTLTELEYDSLKKPTDPGYDNDTALHEAILTAIEERNKNDKKSMEKFIEAATKQIDEINLAKKMIVLLQDAIREHASKTPSSSDSFLGKYIPKKDKLGEQLQKEYKQAQEVLKAALDSKKTLINEYQKKGIPTPEAIMKKIEKGEMLSGRPMLHQQHLAEQKNKKMKPESSDVTKSEGQRPKPNKQ